MSTGIKMIDDKYREALEKLNQKIEDLKQYDISMSPVGDEGKWKVEITTTGTQWPDSTTPYDTQPSQPLIGGHPWTTPGPYEWKPLEPKWPLDPAKWPDVNPPAPTDEGLQARQLMLDSREQMIAAQEAELHKRQKALEKIEAQLKKQQAELEALQKALQKRQEMIDEIERLAGILAGDGEEEATAVQP